VDIFLGLLLDFLGHHHSGPFGDDGRSTKNIRKFQFSSILLGFIAFFWVFVSEEVKTLFLFK
jgi:hypothetical protein